MPNTMYDVPDRRTPPLVVTLSTVRVHRCRNVAQQLSEAFDFSPFSALHLSFTSCKPACLRITTRTPRCHHALSLSLVCTIGFLVSDRNFIWATSSQERVVSRSPPLHGQGILHAYACKLHTLDRLGFLRLASFLRQNSFYTTD